MPTETTAPRLIDANALLEEMKDLMDNENEDDEWNKPLKFALKLIDSAHTVETTDDVLARIPKMIGDFCLESGYTGGSYYAWYSKFEYEYVIMKGTEFRGDTQFEAIKKLEASINTK